MRSQEPRRSTRMSGSSRVSSLFGGRILLLLLALCLVFCNEGDTPEALLICVVATQFGNVVSLLLPAGSDVVVSMLVTFVGTFMGALLTNPILSMLWVFVVATLLTACWDVHGIVVENSNFVPGSVAFMGAFLHS